jgi:acidic leucine-rich nuclear phosphoprotein 32 family protein B
MVGEDHEIIPNEFSNLILDELPIVRLSEADKAFLEEFSNLQSLSMNSTSLASLENFPNAPKLVKLYLDDNKLKGSDVSHLCAQAQNLEVLFICNNQLKELDEVTELSKLNSLKVLDLSNNEVCDKDGYRD